MSVTRRDFVLRSSLTATGLGLARAVAAPAAAAAAAGATATAATAPAKTPAPAAVPAFRPDDWASVRAQFRLDPDYAHLSPFYIVSRPAAVREAIERHRNALDENPFVYLEDHMFMR